ncbi:hypothetical protein KQX54_007051 [Cotesia glomerata]|uniref:Uncharacterized protein n=1 Tax=Cotesia glomerata TaxID=32391 RepID=A0AAV7J1X8_COTGL|nr:hypothetical protein KQX54_007051 [Cotesia glomerata]
MSYFRDIRILEFYLCNVRVNKLLLDNCDTIMKYSPQQQQKERKSESEVASMIATPSRTSRSKNSVHGCSSNRIINNTVSTGIFAWMRVFRMASLLHKIGC